MKRPSLHIVVTAALLALASLLRVADPAPVAMLRQAVFDSYLRAHPRVTEPGRQVRIVDIDEASLAALGQWPWPRTRLAALIDKLTAAGARSIALDIVLAEPDRLSPGEIARSAADVPELAALAAAAAALPSNDAKLAQAIAKGPVVLGFAGDAASATRPPPPRASFANAGDDARLFVPAFPAAVTSLPELASKARGHGAVNWLPSADQLVRRVPLLVRVGDALHPSLTLEALRVGSGQTTVLVKASNASGLSAFGAQSGVELVRVGETVLPTTGTGELELHFAPPDARRYLSAAKVLAGDVPAGAIAGRHIFIGTSATGLLDLRATPLSNAVPGVEIHAQALEQMLEGAHLLRPAFATGAELFFLIAAGALVAFVLARSGPVTAALVGIGAIGLVIASSWSWFKNAGVLFDPVYPALALVAVYLATSLLTFVRTELERARVRAAFGHYVAAPLVEELARDPGKLKLGGEMREVTILFADVRAFSRLAEGRDAQALIAFVNALFTPMADLILEKRGTIDKFMGDAVMAFWNAPLSDPDHARLAVETALAMQAELARLNVSWAAEAAARGEAFEPVRLGIGVNTGDCVVGNVGSPQRFDYSILGDAVNVAARLESATKTYAQPIIVGERTRAAAPEFTYQELATVALPGKTKPERIYALIGSASSSRA